MGRGMGSLGQAAFEFFLLDVVLKGCVTGHSDPKDVDLDQTKCVVLFFNCFFFFFVCVCVCGGGRGKVLLHGDRPSGFCRYASSSRLN